MSNISVEARAFPINEPRNSTVAFASATLKVDGEDLMAIRGVRVMDGEKGLFVSMPQSKDKDGNYHDVAFPLSGELRKEINKVVLQEYQAATKEKKQSIGNKIQEGKQKSSQHTFGAPQRASAKSRAPGLD